MRDSFVFTGLRFLGLLFGSGVHHPRMLRGSVSVASVCLCVCLCVCNALTYESLDPESSFLVRKYIFEIPRSSSYITKSWVKVKVKVKVTGAIKAHLSALFARGLRSVERQSCFKQYLVLMSLNRSFVAVCLTAIQTRIWCDFIDGK